MVGLICSIQGLGSTTNLNRRPRGNHSALTDERAGGQICVPLDDDEHFASHYMKNHLDLDNLLQASLLLCEILQGHQFVLIVG